MDYILLTWKGILLDNVPEIQIRKYKYWFKNAKFVSRKLLIKEKKITKKLKNLIPDIFSWIDKNLITFTAY